MLALQAHAAAIDEDVRELRLQLEGVTVGDEEVSELAGFERADAVGDAENRSGVERYRLQGAIAVKSPCHRDGCFVRQQPVVGRAIGAEGKLHPGLGQLTRGAVGGGVVIVLTRRQGQHRTKHDWNVLRLQQRSHPRCLQSAHDHDPDARAIGKGDRFGDVARGIRRHKQRLPALRHRHHRGQVPVGGALSLGDGGVRARQGDQVFHPLHARIAFLLQVLELAVGIGSSAGPAPDDGRELEAEAGDRLQRGLFPGPAVQVHHRDLSADQSARRHDRDRRDAVDARDRNGVAVGLVGDLRLHRRVDLEHLVHVLEPACARLVQADRGSGIDEARIQLAAFRVNHLGAGRNGHVGAERLDSVAANEQRAALDHRSADGKDPRVGDGHHRLASARRRLAGGRRGRDRAERLFRALRRLWGLRGLRTARRPAFSGGQGALLASRIGHAAIFGQPVVVLLAVDVDAVDNRVSAERVLVPDHDIGVLARFERADACVDAQLPGRIDRHQRQRLIVRQSTPVDRLGGFGVQAPGVFGAVGVDRDQHAALVHHGRVVRNAVLGFDLVGPPI